MPTHSFAAAFPRRLLGPDGLIVVLTILIWTNVWRVQDMFPILAKIKFPMLMLVTALGIFVLDGDTRRRLTGVKGPIVRMLIVLLVIMVIGVPAGLYAGRSFTFLTKDFLPSLAVMTLIAASIRDRGDLEHYMRWTFYGALVYATFVQFNFSVASGGRLGDLVYYDANDFALLLVATLPLGLFTARTGRGLVRILSLAGIGLFVFMLMKSGSRGGLIGFGVVMAFTLFGFTAVPARIRFGSVVAAVGLLVVVGNDAYWEQMATLLNPKADYNLDPNNQDGRMQIWKRGMGYMLQRPIAGVGPRNFPIADGQLSERGRANTMEGGEGHKWSAAHNSFVEVGAETGVIGLMMFVGCLLSAMLTLRREGKSPKRSGSRSPPRLLIAQSLLMAFLGFTVAGVFVSAAYFAFLYALYGILLGMLKLPDDNDSRSAVPVSEADASLSFLPGRVRGGLGQGNMRGGLVARSSA